MKYIPVLNGQNTRKVREGYGLSVEQVLVFTISGPDADFTSSAKFEATLPQAAAALRESGIDLNDLKAVIEVK